MYKIFCRFFLLDTTIGLVGVKAQAFQHNPVYGRLYPELFKNAVYTAEGDAFVSHNGKRFNNRPLYNNQMAAIVITDDRPLVRFGSTTVKHGTVMIALARGKEAMWLHDFSSLTSRCRPGAHGMEAIRPCRLQYQTYIGSCIASGTGVTLHS